MIILFESLIVLFEGFITLFFLFKSSKMVQHYAFIALIYALYITGMCLIKNLWGEAIVLTAFTLLCVFAFTCLFHFKWHERVYYTLVITMLNFLTESISGFLFIEVMGYDIVEIRGNFSIYLIGAALAKFLFFLSVILFAAYQKNRKRKGELPLRQTLVFIIPPFLSIAAAYGLSFIAGITLNNGAIYVVIVLGMLIAINIVIFTLRGILSVQAERILENELQASSLESRIQQYEAEIHYGNEKSKILHDVALHYRVIKELSAVGKLEELSEYVEHLQVFGDIPEENEIIPEYPALDIIIRQKIEKMRELNIEFQHRMEVPPGLPVKIIHMCLLVGNGLDNAIEACEQVEGERKIKLELLFSMNRLIFSVENTSPPREISDNKVVTTKRDKHSHGYGVSIMSDVADKYSGNVLLRYENNLFKFLAILYI